MTERPQVTSAGPPAGAATGRIVFIGTATTLIQAAGFTILTDPDFLHRGQRAYVGMGLTARRLTDPALSAGQPAGRPGADRPGADKLSKEVP